MRSLVVLDVLAEEALADEEGAPPAPEADIIIIIL